jgi:carbon monoxide dehydrogenase subunit G
MPTVTRTMNVAASPEQVINYLKDFANSEEWDSGTQRCTRNDAGPIVPGASWHNVSKVLGFATELTFTLEEVTDRTLVFVGTNDSSTDRDTITVDADGAGSVVLSG